MSALLKYPHAVQQIAVGQHSYPLVVPQDPDGIFWDMRPEDFGPDERLPHWARLWPGAFALGEHLLKTGLQPGTQVIDIGCGLALNGIIAAILGGQVTATDWFHEALDFAQASAALNHTRIQTTWMDWNHPPTDLHADLILGADLLYEQRNHAPLMACIQQLLRPGGQAWLSDPGRPHIPAFLKLLHEIEWPCEALKVGGAHVFILKAQS